MQKNEIIHEELFVGRDLALDYHDGGFPISIVTFEARNKYIRATEPSPFENGYGRGIFAQLGLNEFLVKRSRNHWYQTDEIEKVIDIIKERAQGTSIVTYGGSMGGMAAISLASKLNAKTFIALSPLYDIEEGGEVQDDRWGDEGKIIDFKHNYIRNGDCKDSQGYVFYCPDTVDVEHARCIERMTNATVVPLEYGGHPVSFFLNDTYKLKRLVSEIAHGEFDLNNFHNVVKTNTELTHYPHEKKASELSRIGNYDDAIISMRTASSMNPKIARLPFRLGELLLKVGRLQEAEEAFLQALETDPKMARAHLRLSVIHERQQKIPDAIRATRRALKLAPSKAEFHLRLGDLLRLANRLPEAESSISKAIQLKPESSNAHVRLSYVYADLERWNDAIAAMRQAISLSPDKPEYQLRLGEWQLMAGELLYAEESMAKAIEMSPGNSHYLVRLSYVFAAGKDYARSASAMQKALTISPDRSAYHLRHGECLIKAGELEAAETSMRQAVRLAPDTQRPKDRLRAVQEAIGRQRSKASA